jgi:hypothetical protein
MKSFRRLSLGYFVALAAAAFFVQEASALQNKAIVRAVRGSVQIGDNKGKFVPAKVGAQLGANSIIRTAAGSTADLFLGENGPVVRVREDSQLGIDKLDVDNAGIEKVIDTQLDLRNGKILGSVKKMAAASKYEVKTPVGIAGIRGTEYSIDSRGNLNVVQGQVVIVYIINNVPQPAVTVNAGQSATPPVQPGQQANLVSIQQSPSGTGDSAEIPQLTVNITTNPNGTFTDNNLNGFTTDPSGATITSNNANQLRNTEGGNINLGSGSGATPPGTTTDATTGTTGTTTDSSTTVGVGVTTTTTTTGNFDVTNDKDLNPEVPDDDHEVDLTPTL